MPIVKRLEKEEKDSGYENFPLDHYSYSSFTKFSSNPLMFKVNNINGDMIDTLVSPNNVLGKSCHKGFERYFSLLRDGLEEGEAIKQGHDIGKEYLDGYSDGFIEYNTLVQDRSKLEEKYAFCFYKFISEISFKKEIKKILLIEEMLKFKVQINDRILPIPLKGSPDLVYEDTEGKIIIKDYKITGRYSDADSIDGPKLVQAVFLYFLTYASLGKPPYAIDFEEFKISENKDKSRQTKSYRIVFSDNPLMFDLFYRLYDDITDALMGKQVYVPNMFAIFDKEVSLLSYIHRLDQEDVREREFKRMKVDNITDFLKKKIQNTGAMKKYLETVSKNFISAKTLNYKDMQIEEKIKYKLGEHGLGVEFVDKISGFNITLYRFEPSIGLKMSKLESYVKDIEQVMAVSGIRILAPIPNSDLVGFEIPNSERSFPTKLPIGMGFSLAIGVDVNGDTYRLDIRECPHLLVSGTTGSGKSVCIGSLIKQIKSLDSKEVFLTLLDPKMVELQPYSDGSNVVYKSSIMEIKKELKNLCGAMDARYKIFQEKKVRNIEEYNQKFGKMPYNFVFIEEFGDIIMSDLKETIIVPTGKKNKRGEPEMKIEKLSVSDEIKRCIIILAQKARAAGIHLIITTQRPSVRIVSGEIKANFPTRIAFRTASATDSNIIIDQPGAEQLLGKGDMLVLNPNRKGLERLQGYFN
jgi:hypothetical protein